MKVCSGENPSIICNREVHKLSVDSGRKYSAGFSGQRIFTTSIHYTFKLILSFEYYDALLVNEARTGGQRSDWSYGVTKWGANSLY